MVVGGAFLSRPEEDSEFALMLDDHIFLLTHKDLLLLCSLVTDELKSRSTHGRRRSSNDNQEEWCSAIRRLIEDSTDQELSQLGELPPLQGVSSNLASIGQASNPLNMSVRQAAEYLRVSPNTSYKWTSQGRIPHRKIGTKKLSFSKDELDQFIASRRVADDLDLEIRPTRIAGRKRAGP